MKKLFGLISIFCIIFLLNGCKNFPEATGKKDMIPKIFPDYTDIIIPYNIAPLNFKINDESVKYFVRIHSKEGKEIKIISKNGKIIIPIQRWKKLLKRNKGEELIIEIALKQNNNWIQYKKITNFISPYPIDSYLAYRLLPPALQLWKDLGIYQRNLENYNEKPILANDLTNQGCMNCHSFCNNNPEKMAMQLRLTPTAMLVYQNQEIDVINTRTPFSKSVAAYTSWHPNGKIITSSVNKIFQRFTNSKKEIREVFDDASDLICYDIDSNQIFTHPKISDLDKRETFPCWAPDGNYLYFSSAPRKKDKTDVEDLVKYDIVRIKYNPALNEWGEVETIINSKDNNKSNIIVKVSPDNKFFVFTATHHGSFPIYMPDGDLYIFNLQNSSINKLSCNSENAADSYHSWSSNSKWLVFSSKRYDIQCARPFFTFIDENGNSSKPFVLPQKDPEFYSTYLMTYNVPELIKGPVNVRPYKLARATIKKVKKAQLAPYVETDSRTAATLPQ